MLKVDDKIIQKLKEKQLWVEEKQNYYVNAQSYDWKKGLLLTSLIPQWRTLNFSDEKLFIVDTVALMNDSPSCFVQVVEKSDIENILFKKGLLMYTIKITLWNKKRLKFKANKKILTVEAQAKNIELAKQLYSTV